MSNAAEEIVLKFHSYSPDTITLGVEALTINCNTTNKVWVAGDTLILEHSGATGTSTIVAVHATSVDVNITATNKPGFTATGWELAKV